MDDYRSINTAEYREVQTDVQAQNGFVNRVYGWMCGALALTGVVAWYVAGQPSLVKALFRNPVLFWGILIAQVLLVFGLSAAINRISSAAAAAGFIAYAALNGVLLSSIFLVYTSESLASTFFVTSLTFGVTSLFGYLTKRDLTGLGGFMMMGLIGIIIASVVNIWLRSSALYWATTYIGILIFVGLTAYDTQKIKQMAQDAFEVSAENGKKMALMGALMLYLDFINLFLLLLRLFGGRRD